MADTTAAAAPASPTTGDRQQVKTLLSADAVSGLLEGIGQSIREVLLNRNIFEIIAIWGLGGITLNVAANKVKEVITGDPNYLKLKHEQRRELLAEFMEDAEEIMSQIWEKMVAMKDAIKDFFKYVERKRDEWDARDRRTAARLVTGANKRLKKTRLFPWLQFSETLTPDTAEGR